MCAAACWLWPSAPPLLLKAAPPPADCSASPSTAPASLSTHSLLCTCDGHLQIEFPTHALDGFSCHETEVRAAYKYKHLKAAFTNVAQKEPWSAKVGGLGRGFTGEGIGERSCCSTVLGGA